MTTAIFGPFSALYVCGAPGLLLPLAVGGSLAVYLNSENVPGEPGNADVASAGACSALVGAYFCLLLYATCWRDLEAYFSTFPWKQHTQPVTSKGGVRTYLTRCPFTGLRPTMRCPSCQCRVHERAFHQRDRFVTAPGETVLRWDKAKAALAGDEGPAKGRTALDEALDLRGSVYTGAVSACCVGCATWQKCFNLAQRLALALALTALFFAFVPWAFASFLELIDHAGVVLKIISGSTAVGFGAAALLVQARALVRANAFMCKYGEKVPALRPLVAVPPSSWRAAAVRALCATPWDPLL